MVPRPMAPARAMRSRTCADVIQPCFVFLDFFSLGCLPESFDLVYWAQFSNSLVKHIERGLLPVLHDNSTLARLFPAVTVTVV